MRAEYQTPELVIIVLDIEQCIMSSSNVPGFEPGEDLDEILG